MSTGWREGDYPDAAALMEAAKLETGLSDFGPGDFREGLQVLLNSVKEDAALSEEGVRLVVADQKRRLVNRLEVENWYQMHPEADALPIRGPINIIGLPRTGTTALGNIMSLDAQFRALRGWEQAKPCPPPVAESEANDPRRIAAIQAQGRIPQKLQAMHLFDVDATVEDVEILGMAFHGQGYTLPAYGYHSWWRSADLKSTFFYHRRVIKLLQSRRSPNLWLFKSPHHKFHLEAFLAAYPGTKFIMTHRDPGKSIPSHVSFLSNLFPPSSRHGGHDLQKLGQELSNHLRIGMEMALAARKRIGDDRFFDVYQTDIDADAIGTVQRIYEFLELELRPEAKQQMSGWLEKNRSGAHGVHRYTAEQFGLSRNRLRDDFDFYIKQFDVPIDD